MLIMFVLMVVRGSLVSRELSFGNVIFVVESPDAVQLEVDSLNVVRHVVRLLDGHRASIPVELVNDGDLPLLIDRMLQRTGLDTVRIPKV